MAEQEQVSAGELESNAPRARAIRAMREWIEEGRLAVGEALPSERALSARLGVGRATVRRALQVLEAEGLVVDRGGHVRTVSKGGGADGLMRQVVGVVGGVSSIDVAVLQELGKAGRHALLLCANHMEEGQVQQLMAMKPAGVIVADGPGAIGRKVLDAAAAAGAAVVLRGDGAEVDRVVSDDEAGAYELTQWVIGQGKRRVLTVWKDAADAPWVAARLRGYERAMREAQLEPLRSVHVARVQVDGADKAEAEARLLAGYLMEQLGGANPVDAIMAASDEDVPAIAAACRMLGKDVLVVGWGNTAPAGQVPATLDVQAEQIGWELAKLLLERIGGTLPADPQRRLVRPRLVVLEQKAAAPKPADAAEVPLSAAPQIGAVAVKEEEKGKPLFGWKMEGGRWTLGAKKNPDKGT